MWVRLRAAALPEIIKVQSTKNDAERDSASRVFQSGGKIDSGGRAEPSCSSCGSSPLLSSQIGNFAEPRHSYAEPCERLRERAAPACLDERALEPQSAGKLVNCGRSKRIVQYTTCYFLLFGALVTCATDLFCYYNKNDCTLC